jgi:hypothetical protein
MARTVPHCGLVILLIPNAVSLRARRRLIAASAVNTRASEKGDEPQGYSLTQNQSPAASVKKMMLLVGACEEISRLNLCIHDAVLYWLINCAFQNEFGTSFLFGLLRKDAASPLSPRAK